MKKLVLVANLFVVMLFTACGQATDKSIKTPIKDLFSATLVYDGIQNPWGMAFLPDGAILVTEKAGNLFYCKDGKKKNIGNLPDIYVRGQGGFMDVALHPNYDKNGWIYFSFASAEGDDNGGNTAIMRAKLEGDQLSDKQLLYKGTPNTKKGQHWGSRLAFDDKGSLYFTIGDRGNRDENPQDITKDGGKIYRIHDDGRIPADNPFVDKKGAKTAIFSYGHRNPQGLVKNPFTGEIWNHEHGPRGGDEINIIAKGKNYGWPVITYGINYSGTSITDETSKPGMEQPIYYWVPSIAPSGMDFITSKKYPEWQGNLLVGSLAFQYLERLELKDNKVTYREKLMDGIGRVRSVRQAPDGFIYVGVEGKGIYRLDPK